MISEADRPAPPAAAPPDDLARVDGNGPAPGGGRLDLSRYANAWSRRNKLGRALWQLVWLCLFRPTPRPCHGWRIFLLRCFGARIGRGCAVYPSATIWAPWNLVMGDLCALADRVDCYCVDRIEIGSQAVVSQYSFLCTASHDVSSPEMRLITAPIRIGEGAWVCADVFVGPGVTIGPGAVAAARAVVIRDVAAWTLVGGNPARFLKERRLSGEAVSPPESQSAKAAAAS